MTTSTRVFKIQRHGFLFSVLIALALSPCASFGETTPGSPSGPEGPFAAAVARFKEGKLEDARKIFLQLETKHPGDPTLLLNLGLIAHKEKKSGAALGLWRKGLALHPTDESLLNAVDWLKPKLAKVEIAHEIDSWEELRRVFLLRVSPLAVTIFSAGLLFFSGWLLLRWWGARSRALDQDLAMPPAPVAGFVLLLLFGFMFSISIAMFVDRLDIRGTILVEKAEVRSAPDAAATALFEAFEGMEVVVRDSRQIGGEQWRRVTYPGGMTGWIRDREVLTWADPSERAWGQ